MEGIAKRAESRTELKRAKFREEGRSDDGIHDEGSDAS
jgi:hypothetical protein